MRGHTILLGGHKRSSGDIKGHMGRTRSLCDAITGSMLIGSKTTLFWYISVCACVWPCVKYGIPTWLIATHSSYSLWWPLRKQVTVYLSALAGNNRHVLKGGGEGKLAEYLDPSVLLSWPGRQYNLVIAAIRRIIQTLGKHNTADNTHGKKDRRRHKYRRYRFFIGRPIYWQIVFNTIILINRNYRNRDIEVEMEGERRREAERERERQQRQSDRKIDKQRWRQGDKERKKERKKEKKERKRSEIYANVKIARHRREKGRQTDRHREGTQRETEKTRHRQRDRRRAKEENQTLTSLYDNHVINRTHYIRLKSLNGCDVSRWAIIGANIS